MADDSAFQFILDECGIDVAQELIDRMGGMQVRLPDRDTNKRGPFSCLREKTWESLHQAMVAQEAFYIPRIGNEKLRTMQRERACSMRQDGTPISEIARTMRVSDRTIYKWLNKSCADTKRYRDATRARTSKNAPKRFV